MSPSTASRIEVAAPAKLNLGLEAIDRRDDGFHEIATIFVAIDFCDQLTLTTGDRLVLHGDGGRLAGADDLALRALQALRQETGHSGGALIELSKRIPMAAGLGGGASDAAAALLAARDLWRLDLSDERLRKIGAQLGSDVPFFLEGGCALGRGRGEILEPLPPPPDTWFVVVVPRLTIPSKTATLYASLTPDDFSDGSRVATQAARLSAGLSLDTALLANAFTRPLYARLPRLADLPGMMADAGAPAAAISGAGPAHYVPVGDPEDAERIAVRLRELLGDLAQVVVTAPARGRLAKSRPL